MKNFLSVFVFCMTFCVSVSAFAARCADYSTCEEAVIAWCRGEHPRADGDNDGIPCENVCSSLEQVEQIKAKINCKR